MNYRNISKAGISISEIGFGAWGIGGPHDDMDAYGPVDDKESLRALHSAIDNGINFFDTSPLYGYGRSESLIGKSVRNVRHSVYIATKVGYVDGSGRQDFSADYIFKSVENSLKRLKTDYVDFLQLHDLPSNYRSDEVFFTLRKLVEKGYVRFLGISVKSPDDAIRYIGEYSDVALIQANLNVIDQRGVNNGLIDRCSDAGVAFIARTPFSFGLFLDSSESSSYADGDHRSKWSQEQLNIWSDSINLFSDNLFKTKQEKINFALNFCLSVKGVSCVIPGMLTSNQVEENVLASSLAKMSSDELNLVNEVYRNNSFFIGE